jgi:hypothetical protein
MDATRLGGPRRRSTCRRPSVIEKWAHSDGIERPVIYTREHERGTEARNLTGTYLSLKQGQVVVRFLETDRASAETTATALVHAGAILTTYFGLDRLPEFVCATLAPHRRAFDQLVADVLRVEIEIPSDPHRIAQAQGTQIVFLSPSAYASESAYEYFRDDYVRMVHHELVHVVQELLSPGIENSPLWWDEGLAVYLSGQWRHGSSFRFREPVLEALRDTRLPTFSQVEQDRSLAYSFGWTLVRFIEWEKGNKAIADVVRRMEDGDVLGALDEDPVSFEVRWQEWLPTGL